MMAGIMQFIEGRKDLNWSMHLLLHLHISVLITWVQTQNAATPLISEPPFSRKQTILNLHNQCFHAGLHISC